MDGSSCPADELVALLILPSKDPSPSSGPASRHQRHDPQQLAGHSTGGVIALLLALRSPGRVRGLLLSNTGANMKGHGDVESIVASLTSDWGPELRSRILERCFHYPPEQALRRELETYAASVSQRSVIEALTSQLRTDLSSQLGNLDMPVVVAHGSHDTVRPTTHAAFLADNAPRGELHLLDGGHTPMVENPAEYGRAVDHLLDLT